VSHALRLMDALRGTFGAEEDEFGQPIFGGRRSSGQGDGNEDDGGGGGDGGGSELPDLSHLAPDVWSYAIAIQSCARVHDWRTALALLEEAEAAPGGGCVNDVAYTNAIAACSACGEWQQALAVLQRMHTSYARGQQQQQQQQAAARGAGASDDAAAAAGPRAAAPWTREAGPTRAALKPGRGLPGPSLPGPPGAVAYNACITACGRAGQVDAALAVLLAMLRGHFDDATAGSQIHVNPSNLRPGSHRGGGGGGSARAAMAADGGDGDGGDGDGFGAAAARAEVAVRAIADAVRDGDLPPRPGTAAAAAAAPSPPPPQGGGRQLPHPDAVSFNAALHACERAGLWRVALQLLDGMPASWRDAVSFNTAMVACGRAGQWAATLELLADLEAQADRLGPLNAHSYGAALAACAQAVEAADVGGSSSGDGHGAKAAADAGASLLARSGPAAAWRSSVACWGPAAAVLRAAGAYDQALALELQLRKADPKQAMRLNQRRLFGGGGGGGAATPRS
jgi:pentatricopeptide repeat protein